MSRYIIKLVRGGMQVFDNIKRVFVSEITSDYQAVMEEARRLEDEWSMEKKERRINKKWGD